MPSMVTGRMADSISNVLNGRWAGAPSSRDVRVSGKLEACHDGLPCPMLIPQCASSLSDLSKNRDFLEYYVSRSLGNIVELRSDRYSF